MTSSNGPTEVHPLDDLAAYAVDALDDHDRDVVADHLTQCATCRGDLAIHHDTVALLAPEEGPPAAVWQRIAAGIGAPEMPDPHARADAVRALPPPTRVIHSSARPSLRLGWAAAAAVAAVALTTGGVTGYVLGTSGGDDADIASLAGQAEDLATLVSPEGDAVARVVADDDGAYLVLSGLDNLPEGRAYQLWSLTEAQPVSLGMLGRDGTNTVAFRLPPAITDVAISEAPTHGDVIPNGSFIASGTIDSA